MKNFENEYRNLVQEDMPDLWDRIEAGLVEKNAPQEMVVTQKEEAQQEATQQEAIQQGSNQQEVKLQEIKGQEAQLRVNNQLDVNSKENAIARKGKTNIYKFVKYAGVAVAACLLFVLVMPTAIGMLTTGGSSESAKSAQNDMAAAEMAEAPAAMMSENAKESAKLEAAMEEVVPMEGAAPAEGTMEDGVREESVLTEGVAESSTSKEEAIESKKVTLEDGTVIENLQVCILEIENMNYHTVYRACVEADGTGTFQIGDVVEFISVDVATQENGSGKETQDGGSNAGGYGIANITIGETITVTLSYDADADISLHLMQ